MASARFVGGPLDGQTVERRHGKWSAYLAEDGGKMTTTDGDRQVWRAQFKPEKVKGFYRFRSHLVPKSFPSEFIITYVHSSVLIEEFAEERVRDR